MVSMIEEWHFPPLPSHLSTAPLLTGGLQPVGTLCPGIEAVTLTALCVLSCPQLHELFVDFMFMYFG